MTQLEYLLVGAIVIVALVGSASVLRHDVGTAVASIGAALLGEPSEGTVRQQAALSLPPPPQAIVPAPDPVMAAATETETQVEYTPGSDHYTVGGVRYPVAWRDGESPPYPGARFDPASSQLVYPPGVDLDKPLTASPLIVRVAGETVHASGSATASTTTPSTPSSADSGRRRRSSFEDRFLELQPQPRFSLCRAVGDFAGEVVSEAAVGSDVDPDVYREALFSVSSGAERACAGRRAEVLFFAVGLAAAVELVTGQGTRDLAAPAFDRLRLPLAGFQLGPAQLSLSFSPDPYGDYVDELAVSSRFRFGEHSFGLTGSYNPQAKAWETVGVNHLWTRGSHSVSTFAQRNNTFDSLSLGTYYGWFGEPNLAGRVPQLQLGLSCTTFGGDLCTHRDVGMFVGFEVDF